MTTFPLQAIFNRGELTPVLHSRIDLEYFRMSYKYGENFVLTRHGGLMNRPGTKYLGVIKDQTRKARLVKFVFSRTQIYQIEFGHMYLRFWALDGRVVAATNPISGITGANPGVVTYTGTDNLANGDRVVISGVAGMHPVNGVEFEVAGVNVGANTFQLSGVDTSGYPAYTSGGTVSKIYEVATTYTEDELDDIQFAQSNDVIYIAHPAHKPAKLQRFAETNWTLSDVTFFDGPYLPSPTGTRAGVTLSTNGGPGAVTSVIRVAGAASAGTLYDQNEATYFDVAAQTGTIRFTWAAAKVLNSIVIVGPNVGGGSDNKAPKNWTIRAANNLAGPWTTLDSRSNEIGWQQGEARYFEFYNETAYTIYEWILTANNGDGGATIVTEIYWGQNGDYATAITATFSSVLGINGGIGFQASDVGRHIRLFNTNDAKWRWFKITAVTSTTVIDGKFYGYPMRDDYHISEWKLGAFSVESGWPAAVAFYLDRLAWARVDEKPLGVYLSQVGAYENHQVSDPLVDDDAITINIASNQTEEILWMVEGVQDLIIGTSVAIRTLGKGDTGKAFSPSNFAVNKQTQDGASSVSPAGVGSAIIYPDFHGKALREFLYSFEVDSYVSPEVSILSDHLLKTGILFMDFASAPEPILWIVNGNGELVGLTYDKENKVVGMHRSRIAGRTSANALYSKVECISVVPGTSQDDSWLVVQRQVGATTKRYVERVTKFADNEMPKEDAWYLDCAVEYSGAATGVFTGLMHLVGETVQVYANNTVFIDLVVSATGTVTLPGGATTTRAVIGLAQSQYFDLLSPVQETPDGLSFNRKKQSKALILDYHRSRGLKVGTERKQERIQYRENGSKTANPTELCTGLSRVYFDSRWEDMAGSRIVQDKPYPAFIRSIMLVHDGEP